MPELSADKPLQRTKLLWYFLLAWTVMNVIQAYTLELHADEAYYWLYSRFLDWGYYDHPPMVALFIRFGDSIMHNELGLRLLTITVSTASIYILWLILKNYSNNVLLFITIISCMFMCHMYGFTTTPDAPLFFFTVVFYYFYRKYIDNDSWALALILGLVVACLLYSKYHAVLLIGFTTLANLKLLKRPTFLFIAILAAVLFIPHILWQAQHDFPSLNYHLSERSSDKYHAEYTYLYPIGQILMAGPLIGWFLFYKGFTAKVTDTFTRTLMVNCIGTPLFFLITSFRGEVQPQWTYIAFAPLILLIVINFAQKPAIPKWFYPLAVLNIAFLLFIRVTLVAGYPLGRLDAYFGFKDWSHAIYAKAGDHYVIFDEGFQNPSKYDYYNNTVKGFSYDSRYYRRTQFDIWPIEDSLQGKRIYYVLRSPMKNVTTDTIQTSNGDRYGGWVDSARTYQRVDITLPEYKLAAKAGQQVTFDLTITNPYDHPISFSNEGRLHRVFLEASFFDENNKETVRSTNGDFNKITLAKHTEPLTAANTAHYKFTLTSPVQKGSYDLIFSLRTEPFAGNKNSRIVKFTVQ